MQDTMQNCQPVQSVPGIDFSDRYDKAVSLPGSVSVGNRYRGDKGIPIGRPSVFGNPFSVQAHGRDECIRLYREWLWSQVEAGGPVCEELLALVDRARSGESISLLCVCKPKSCHGDIIKEAIEKLLALEAD